MKDIKTKFDEVEKRVKAVVTENASLRKQVRELEAELAKTRRESHELQNFHGKKLHIREKIERILQSLETAEKK